MSFEDENKKVADGQPTTSNQSGDVTENPVTPEPEAGPDEQDNFHEDESQDANEIEAEVTEPSISDQENDLGADLDSGIPKDNVDDPVHDTSDLEDENRYSSKDEDFSETPTATTGTGTSDGSAPTESKEKSGFNPESITSNEQVQKAVTFSKNYFAIFLRKLKRPSSDVLDVPQYYGYVTFLLVALAQAILVVTEVSRIATLLLGGFASFLGTDYFTPTFTDFLRLVILFLILNGLAVAAVFATSKWLSQSTDSFHVITNRLAGFLSPVIVVLLAGIICVILSIFPLSVTALLFAASVIGVATGIVFVLSDHVRGSKHRLNDYYIISGILLALVIIDALIIRLLGGI